MSNFLQDNKAEMLRYAEYISGEINDFQTIKAYMNNRVGQIKLDARQTAMLERWQFIYNQLSSGKYSDEEVRLQVMVDWTVSWIC